MFTKIYEDPDESLGKYAMRRDKSNVEYFTIISFQDKTIHKTDTHEEALAWVEQLIKENYDKPLGNRHRFFRRDQNIVIAGDRMKFKILNVQELDVFLEFTVK
ncbi:MAG: hypothetical protein ACW99F_09985 [Candidatus Hodarchaeales archaeon]|jgi:hypothetical protein